MTIKTNIFCVRGRSALGESCGTLELLAGNKVVMEATDILQIDCSVADKLSGTLSIMEIT